MCSLPVLVPRHLTELFNDTAKLGELDISVFSFIFNFLFQFFFILNFNRVKQLRNIICFLHGRGKEH